MRTPSSDHLLVQVRKDQTFIRNLKGGASKIAQNFRKRHCVLLPSFIEKSLLSQIKDQVLKAEFYNRRDKGIALESCMKKNQVFDFLHFLLNDQKLFEFIETITGCAPIRCFKGRLYQMISGRGHYDSWHSDMDGKRMIGLSINLSPQVYEGGVFQITSASCDKEPYPMPNTGFGNAILFRISDILKHRVTPIEGVYPKIAFAGWFQNSPSFLSLIKPRKKNAIK